MDKLIIKEALSINGRTEFVTHQFLEYNVKDIPDIPENKHIFDLLASSSNKDVREAISKKENLSKKAKTILGFMEKLTYYDKTHN